MIFIHSEASAHSWCLVEHFWHDPRAVGLILHLLYSPNGNQNFERKQNKTLYLSGRPTVWLVFTQSDNSPTKIACYLFHWPHNTIFQPTLLSPRTQLGVRISREINFALSHVVREEGTAAELIHYRDGQKKCPRLRDSASGRGGEFTQPRTHLFGQLCILFYVWFLSEEIYAYTLGHMLSRDVFSSFKVPVTNWAGQ